MAQISDAAMLKLLKTIPKTEIHIHAEAVTSAETYHKLNIKHKINKDLKSPKDFARYTKVESLKDMIESFTYLQSFFQEPEDFKLMIDDVLQYSRDTNTPYMEIFFSPSIPVQRGLDFNEILTIIENEIVQVKRAENIIIKVIVDVSRSFGKENSHRNLMDLLNFKENFEKDNTYIGIGLGGGERGNRAADHKEIFDLARLKNLQVVAHAGEEVGPESIWEALLILKAARIGHGTSAIYEKKLMNYLRKNRIPIEVCPSSNIVTQGFITDLKKHPIKKFFDKGLLVTLNTDDPFFFNVDLNEEYVKIMRYLGFSLEEVFKLIKNGIYSTFMSDKDKDKFWKNTKAVIKESTKQI